MLRPGIKVLVVNDAGQSGVWENVGGRLGGIRTVAALRRHIICNADIAVTKRGADNPASQQFVDFLKSREGAAIFSCWGLDDPPAA